VETLQEETLRCQSEMVTPPLPPRLSVLMPPPSQERLGIENLSFRNEMVSLRDRVQQLEEKEKEKQDTVLAVRTSSPHLSSC
jgi:hypothetical protein